MYELSYHTTDKTNSLTSAQKPVIINSSKQKEKMNLKNIVSVQDLIKMNEESETPITPRSVIIKNLTDPIYKEDPEVGMEVITHIVESLIGFHMEAIDDYIKQGDNDNVPVWAADMTKLQVALSLLNDVAL